MLKAAGPQDEHGAGRDEWTRRTILGRWSRLDVLLLSVVVFIGLAAVVIAWRSGGDEPDSYVGSWKVTTYDRHALSADESMTVTITKSDYQYDVTVTDDTHMREEDSFAARADDEGLSAIESYGTGRTQLRVVGDTLTETVWGEPILVAVRK
jgi:hypothetical protein